MKQKIIVAGAGGLIGSHMCRRLKAEGNTVIGLSRSPWRHGENPCDEFWPVDLRYSHPQFFHNADCVYQFACEVGGLGFISDYDNAATMLRNSTQIDMSILDACRREGVNKIFFASSACVYNIPGKRFYAESDAIPANPSNEFAWQKLFAERLYQAYANNYGMNIRIGRLFNTYGTNMAWTGGKEKSVAALCRKIAEAKDGGVIEVWGNGEQTRSYTYIDDCVEGICRLMQSDIEVPVNIGPQQEVTIRDLVNTISRIAGKHVFMRFGDGPTGVSKICSDNALIRKELHWEPSITVEQGLATVYPWVQEQLLTSQT